MSLDHPPSSAVRPGTTRELVEMRARSGDRLHARLMGLSSAEGRFIAPGEPRDLGAPHRGMALVAARPSDLPWRRSGPGGHAFGWLEDLAACADPAAILRARHWVRVWLSRHGGGAGPGWHPLTTAWRMIRLIDHAEWLLHGKEGMPEAPISRHLVRAGRFVARRHASLSDPVSRMQTLAILIVAGRAVDALEPGLVPAQTALEPLCRDAVDAEGGIASRNPEDLARLYILLSRAHLAAEAARSAVRAQHRAALDRIAPALRGLRHADGGLARFHGGDGAVPALDAALRASGRDARPASGVAMGYVRLARSRTTVITDVAGAPAAPGGLPPHASTLAFEMTSARRPIVVGCGPGQTFGAELDRASRRRAAHSTLDLDGVDLDPLPGDVQVDGDVDGAQAHILAGHNAFAAAFGLIHVRRLDLSADGRMLGGEDVLTAVTETERRRFADALAKSGSLPGLAFTLRFHLHPEVDALQEDADGPVTLTLRSGEIWHFRLTGDGTVRLDPGLYLEKTRAAPVEASQIVVQHRAHEVSTSVRWSIAKDRRTPDVVRDLKCLDVAGLGLDQA